MWNSSLGVLCHARAMVELRLKHFAATTAAGRGPLQSSATGCASRNFNDRRLASLSHSSSMATRCDRYGYLPEKRAALQKLETHFKKLLG